MRTSLDLCVCLLTLCGGTLGQDGPGVKVVVEEDSDAVLPCFPSTKEDITAKVFDWRKDESRKDVFFYVAGYYYNNGLTGQDEQFKGRVSHYQEQLMNGNASIKINNTKMADSGNYSCIFPHLQGQTFNIELVVEPILRDRSGEISGASPEPYVTTLDVTKDWSLLQCVVRRASPKPKVEWQDSAGNILPAEEPQVSERGGRYYVTLKTTVTKTGHYRCVATQEEISHQIHAEIYVKLNGAVNYWWWAAILIVLVVGLLLVPVLHLVFGILSCILCLVPGQDDRDRVVSPFGQGRFLGFSSAFPLEQFLNFSSGACGFGGGDEGCDDGCDGGCDE